MLFENVALELLFAYLLYFTLLYFVLLPFIVVFLLLYGLYLLVIFFITLFKILVLFFKGKTISLKNELDEKAFEILKNLIEKVKWGRNEN